MNQLNERPRALYSVTRAVPAISPMNSPRVLPLGCLKMNSSLYVTLVARAMAQQRPFALVAGDHVLEPGDGSGQLERALDALAHVDFTPDASAPAPPAYGT